MTHLGSSGSPVEGQIERRIFAGILLVLAVWSGLLARLFYLQVMEGDRYRVSAERNSVRTLRVPALRGRILDRNGEVLVDSRPAFDVHVVPYQTPSLERTLTRISGLTGVDVEDIRHRVGNPTGLLRFRPVLAVHDLDRDAMARVGERIWALPGVMTDVSPLRYYWFGERAAHLVGRLGEVSLGELQEQKGQGYRQGDLVGKQGIERVLDSALRGTSGGRNVLVDARGREIEELNYIAPQPGRNVVLTIDMRLQRIAEESLDELKKNGAVVALDPRNGQVRVLASRPAFDPNRFADGVQAEECRKLLHDEDRPLLDRAIQGQYPPGSTYKVVTALAGLERGVITDGFRVHCSGSFRLGRRVYRCWKKEGHGDMDLHNALVRSCDVFFYRVAELLKPSDHQPAVNILAYYARALGLGSATQIGLDHEMPGLVPTSEWKERKFHEPWMDGETISLAIGQGANQWTPLQMANLYATIGNGGTRYRPQLIQRVTDASGKVTQEFEPEVAGQVPISARALDLVRDALRGVVNEPHGTAYAAMQGLPKDVQVAGKTGTAQVVNMGADPPKDADLPEELRDHAWFVSFVPVEQPRIAIAVLVEHGGHGASAAAPIAKKLIAAFLEDEKKDAQPVTGPAPAPEPASAEQAKLDLASKEAALGRN
jgi:penicillin-binding protein 2